MTSRIAAFFDLDNTIVPGPAIEHPYFRLLWRRGLVGPKDLLRSVGVLLRDIPPFSFDPLRRYKAYLAGKPIESIEAPAQYFFWEHILPRISEQARRALEEHRAQGHRLVLLTGCPDFLVDSLATYLKLDHVIAGRLERADTVFTGGMVGPDPYREGKRLAAAPLAPRDGAALRARLLDGRNPGDLPAPEAGGPPRAGQPD